MYIESNTRSIEVKGDKIIYTLNLDGIKDYLTYDKQLLNILMLDSLKPFRDDGRLRIKIRNNKTDINMYLYDLAYACYSGAVKADSFINDIQKYYEYKSFNNLSIDHADNNIYNNTKYNLSMMCRTINAVKSDIIARVKMPAYLNTAYYDNKYRVQVLWAISAKNINDSVGGFCGQQLAETAGVCAMHLICDTAEKYVNCLQYITSLNCEWAKPLKDGREWVKNNNSCWCADINNSMHAQAVLSKMSETDFQVYDI